MSELQIKEKEVMDILEANDPKEFQFWSQIIPLLDDSEKERFLNTLRSELNLEK